MSPRVLPVGRREAARRITVPIEFDLQWDDQQTARERGLALFDASASTEKSLHVNAGSHMELPWNPVRYTPKRVCPGRVTRPLRGVQPSEEATVSALASVSEGDLRRLLRMVSPEAVSADGPEIHDQVLRGPAELIPSACVSFFVMDTRRREVIAGQEVLLADLPPDDASEGTVRKHLEHICARLEVGGRTEALARMRHHLAG